MKKIKNMTKAELVELIAEICEDNDLWRCVKCGSFQPNGHVCHDCCFDPTADGGGIGYKERKNSCVTTNRKGKADEKRKNCNGDCR